MYTFELSIRVFQVKKQFFKSGNNNLQNLRDGQNVRRNAEVAMLMQKHGIGE